MLPSFCIAIEFLFSKKYGTGIKSVDKSITRE